MTLNSLRHQHGLCDIAIMDASGDDRVPDLCASYTDLITWRRHSKGDAGQSAAIMEGWQNTSAPFVGWLNDDDFLLPGALSIVQTILQDNPNCDVVYGQSILLDDLDRFTGYFPSFSDDLARLGESCLISQPACFVRRSMMERVGGVNGDLHYTMDWDFWLRLQQAGAVFKSTTIPLAAVRHTADTKTFSGGFIRTKELDMILKRHAPLTARVKTHIGDYLYRQMTTGGRMGQLAIRRLLHTKRKFRGTTPPVFHGLRSDGVIPDGKARIALPVFDNGPHALDCFIDGVAESVAVTMGKTRYMLAQKRPNSWSANIELSAVGTVWLDLEIDGAARRLVHLSCTRQRQD